MTVALRLLMYINTNSEDDQTIPNSSTLPAFSSVLSINTLIKHNESNGSRPSPCINFRLEPCLRTVYAARHHQTTVVCTNAIKQSTFTRQKDKPDDSDIGLKPPQGFDRRSSRPASSAQRKSQDEQAAQDLSTPSFSPSFLTSPIPPSSRTLTHNTYKRQRSFDSSNSSDSFKRQHS